MIRVLLDTNIVLDVLLDRQPWNSQAKAIWQAHLDNQIAAHVTATTRDPHGFVSSEIEAIEPEELLNRLAV